ncbi:sensor histidine kinase [Sphingomonas sp. MMS24-JH45]
MTVRVPRAGEEATRRNLSLLVQLRWLAVAGQLATILAVPRSGISLPLVAMLAVLALLAAVNLAAMATRRRWPATDAALLATLLVEALRLPDRAIVAERGARRPVSSRYTCCRSCWARCCWGRGRAGCWWRSPASPSPRWRCRHPRSRCRAASGVRCRRPMCWPIGRATRWRRCCSSPSPRGSRATCATATRGSAALRQRAGEEEQIVRMGLLASGAAHELGTPLASLLIMLGDWRDDATVREHPALAAEVEEMRAEVARCKEIVAGILFAAGEVTGEAPERTTLARFLAAIVAVAAARDPDRDRGPDRRAGPDRRRSRAGAALTNLLDNAADAGARAIRLMRIARGGRPAADGDRRRARLPPEMLLAVGRPYNSTKARRGAGLGLFLASNVLRTLGGSLEARNREGGGADVVLRLPFDALALEACRRIAAS